MSDHDAQLVELLDLTYTPSRVPRICRREINDLLIQKFLTLLSYENWEGVFLNNDINIMFNSFLDIYMKIFQSCFLITQ